MFLRGRQQALFEELVIELFDLSPLRLRNDGPEQLVFDLALLPVQNARLSVGADTSSEGLGVDNDLNTILIGAMLDGYIERRHCDSLTRQPANALEGEDLVGIVTQGFVLDMNPVRSGAIVRENRVRTSVKLPARLRVVISAGTAMMVKGLERSMCEVMEECVFEQRWMGRCYLSAHALRASSGLDNMASSVISW